MAIEIVDLPIKNGDFPSLCKRLSEAKSLYFGHGTVNDTAQVVGGLVSFSVTLRDLIRAMGEE